ISVILGAGLSLSYLSKKPIPPQSEANPGEFIGVAIFESKEAYLANGKDPEQDKWYGTLRAVLQEDPVWEDGEYLVGN
ncbi:MAG: hypothetical protein O2821_13360, partial [Chloroflexi bacterium]|nr:hypothetical protein [Chloroflexota bacterium]